MGPIPFAHRISFAIDLESKRKVSRLAQKRLTSNFFKVDLRDLKNAGWCLRLPYGYAQIADNAVTIDWCDRRITIPVIQTFPHFGGARLWFQCPKCRERARIIYLPNFACRNCLGLIHPSTRKSSLERSIAQASQIRRNLGGTGALLDPFPRRPAGMKRKTWLRLFEKANRAERTTLAFIEKFVTRHSRD